MALKGKTKIYCSAHRNFCYIPKSLIDDSAFPLKIGTELKISIQGKKMIIENV